jgi:molecular chaperone GrpE (heat shock protein)
VSHSEPAHAPNAVSRLGRLIGLHPIPADVSEELTALRAEVSRLTQAQAEWQASQEQGQARLAAILEALDRLEKQTLRSGKEQFKANALAEAQQQSAKALLEQLRAAESVREREAAELREALKSAKAEGRREVLRGLLPVVDGLGEALSAGERQLAGRTGAASPRAEGQGGPAVARPLPLAMRLIGAWDLLTRPAARRSQSGAAPDAHPETLAAWLRGLALVQARLLGLLAAEDIHPNETEGEYFDPHRHVAIDTVPAADGMAPGVIVQEARRGYRQGQTVLRYAEVVVAK